MTMTDVKIQVPVEMASYVAVNDKQSELMRNAMLLYPYINNLTISHGKAAEILGIRKYELIDLYNSLGLPYLSQDIQEVEEEVQQIQCSSFINRVNIDDRKAVDLLRKRTGLDIGESEAIILSNSCGADLLLMDE